MIELGFYRSHQDDPPGRAHLAKSPPTAAICWKIEVHLWVGRSGSIRGAAGDYPRNP